MATTLNNKEKLEVLKKKYSYIIFKQSKNTLCKCNSLKYFMQIPNWGETHFARLPIDVLHYIYLICTGTPLCGVTLETYLEDLEKQLNLPLKGNLTIRKWLFSRFPYSIVFPSIADCNYAYAHRQLKPFFRKLVREKRWYDIRVCLQSIQFFPSTDSYKQFLRETKIGELPGKLPPGSLGPVPKFILNEWYIETLYYQSYLSPRNKRCIIMYSEWQTKRVRDREVGIIGK